MSAARPADESAPDAVAAALADAPFVRVLARADGDALAAAGLLARALRERAVPFQIHADPDPTSESSDADADTDVDDALVVTTGVAAASATRALARDDTSASVSAAAVSRQLGVDPDPVLALAGAVAAGTVPGGDGTDELLADARDRGLLQRRPGVAIPTADLADGLAHSTLLWAPFSGDPDAAHEVLAPLALPIDGTDSTGQDGAEPDALGEDDHRRVASLVAVETVAIEEAIPGAAEALERAVRPYATPQGPFATLGGYADVLGAVAREQPGTGVALALGHRQAREAALEAWRSHAKAVHTALATATTGRYDGLLVARLEGDLDCGRLATAARLLLQFRSPEPIALTIAEDSADGTAAAAVSEQDRQLGRAMADTVASLPDAEAGSIEAAGYGTGRCGEAQFDTDASTFIAAFREAL